MGSYYEVTEIWTRKACKKQGQKTCRIELYPAEQFRWKWRPDKRDDFSPKVPLRTKDRVQYWQGRYRVKVDRRWYGKARYCFLTKTEIFKRFLKG